MYLVTPHHWLSVILTVRFELCVKSGGFSPPLGLTGSHLGVLVATLCLWREKRRCCCCVEGLRETPQSSSNTAIIKAPDLEEKARSHRMS